VSGNRLTSLTNGVHSSENATFDYDDTDQLPPATEVDWEFRLQIESMRGRSTTGE